MLATPLEHTSPHPSTCKSSGMGLSPASAGFGKSDAEEGGRTSVREGQKAEERLAAATEGGFEPPLKALVY